jgi:hypothetical protein
MLYGHRLSLPPIDDELDRAYDRAESNHPHEEQPSIFMQQANYLTALLCQCSDKKFGQDAIEWAVKTNLVALSYYLAVDVPNVMARYDFIITAYRHRNAGDLPKAA